MGRPLLLMFAAALQPRCGREAWADQHAEPKRKPPQGVIDPGCGSVFNRNECDAVDVSSGIPLPAKKDTGKEGRRKRRAAKGNHSQRDTQQKCSRKGTTELTPGSRPKRPKRILKRRTLQRRRNGARAIGAA